MTAPSVAAWEAFLSTIRDELLTSARAHPKEPASRVLDNGWRFAVSVSDRGRVGYRFRAWNDGQTVQVDFLLEARRLASLLGAESWKIEESKRAAFLEVLYIAPADSPVPPKEAA